MKAMNRFKLKTVTYLVLAWAAAITMTVDSLIRRQPMLAYLAGVATGCALAITGAIIFFREELEEAKE